MQDVKHMYDLIGHSNSLHGCMELTQNKLEHIDQHRYKYWEDLVIENKHMQNFVNIDHIETFNHMLEIELELLKN